MKSATARAPSVQFVFPPSSAAWRIAAWTLSLGVVAKRFREEGRLILGEFVDALTELERDHPTGYVRHRTASSAVSSSLGDRVRGAPPAPRRVCSPHIPTRSPHCVTALQRLRAFSGENPGCRLRAYLDSP